MLAEALRGVCKGVFSKYGVRKVRAGYRCCSRVADRASFALEVNRPSTTSQHWAIEVLAGGDGLPDWRSSAGRWVWACSAVTIEIRASRFVRTGVSESS